MRYILDYYSVVNFSLSLEQVYRIWERFYKLYQYTAIIKESIVLKKTFHSQKVVRRNINIDLVTFIIFRCFVKFLFNFTRFLLECIEFCTTNNPGGFVFSCKRAAIFVSRKMSYDTRIK